MKTKPGSKRLIQLLIGVIALIAIVGFASWGRKSDAAEFMTAKVEKGRIRKIVSATGTLQAVTTVQVGSQVSGTISALYADFNSVVKKDQIVAQLDAATFQAQVAQAHANLEQARANLIDAQAKVLAAQSTVQSQRSGVSSAEANLAALKAQRDDAGTILKRQESLVSSGLIPQQDLETARTTYKAAEARYNQAAAQLEQARTSEKSSASAGLAQASAAVQQARAQIQQSQAALRLAEVNLSHTTIRSPINGVVVSRNVDVGQTVAASLSAPTLFTIANDLTRMRVIANIDQADIGVINQNNRVSFTVDAFPGEDFRGLIQQIRLDPQNVQNVVTYNVVIEVDNPDLKLRPGMTASLTMTIAERNDVLKVANGALRFRPQTSQDQKGTSQDESAGTRPGQQARQRQQNPGGSRAAGEDRVAAPSSAVLPGQTRIVWVLGENNEPQSHKIKIGITDGRTTEIVAGDLKEGDPVIISQNLPGAKRTQTNQTPPGFGGMPGGGGGRR